MKGKCLVCLIDVHYIMYSGEALDSAKLGALLDGNDFLIYSGYGSRFDETLFKAFICDDCLSVRQDLGIIFEVVKGDDHE